MEEVNNKCKSSNKLVDNTNTVLEDIIRPLNLNDSKKEQFLSSIKSIESKAKKSKIIDSDSLDMLITEYNINDDIADNLFNYFLNKGYACSDNSEDNSQDNDEEFIHANDEDDDEDESGDTVDPYIDESFPKINNANPIKSYLNNISTYKLLTKDEEIALAKRIEQGDEEAKQELTEHNLRLVVNLAKSFIGRGLSLQDLIQDGNMGLMKAADKFDYRKNCRFSTYATWWINQALSEAVKSNGHTIRLPAYIVQAVSKINRTTNELILKLNRAPSYKEISDALNGEFSPEKIERFLWYASSTAIRSTDEKRNDDEKGDSLIDIIPDNEDSIEDYLINTNDHENVNKLLQVLDDREKNVITEYFGLGDEEGKTLEQIGQQLGVTRERVRQIKFIAIKKMQEFAQNKYKTTNLHNETED